MRGRALLAGVFVTAALAPALAADPLASLLWKARPVVVFAPGPDDPEFKRQVAMFDGETRLFADYEIRVVLLPSGDLRRRLGAPPSGFAVVLVGKDGDAKMIWRRPVEASRILALIDAMPMRRDEVAKRRAP